MNKKMNKLYALLEEIYSNDVNDIWEQEDYEDGEDITTVYIDTPVFHNETGEQLGYLTVCFLPDGVKIFGSIKNDEWE